MNKTKVCRRCGERKPVSGFYSHNGKHAPSDRLQAYCKKCSSQNAMERAKTPEGRRYYRQWKSRWLKTQKGKQSQAKQAAAYKRRNPRKVKVRALTSLAIELGILKRPR